MLRIPHCLDNRLIDGGKAVSLTHPPHFLPNLIIISRDIESVVFSFCRSLPAQTFSDLSPTELTTIFYCLIWDSPNLEGQVPVFISPGKRVAQLYPPGIGFPSSGEWRETMVDPTRQIHSCESCRMRRLRQAAALAYTVLRTVPLWVLLDFSPPFTDFVVAFRK
jgi:hypothetical protein